MRAFLFPGQGSQQRGMGAGLFDSVREFAAIEPEIDRLLGYSIRDVCLNVPPERLTDTRYTQPCLFVVNALHYYDALTKHGRPDMLAGHSLGEYDALMAAGAFDLLTGVRLVAKRGALMAAAHDGGMAAVVRFPSDDVERVLADAGLDELDVANYNAPTQTVIAGPKDALTRAAPIFEGRGAAFVPLPVSAAFHSRYMADAARQFARFLADVTFAPLEMPVLSNVLGEPYPQGCSESVIRLLLIRQITRPVRWMPGIRHLQHAGVTTFIETGPGAVLTKLCQQMEQPVLA